MLSTLRLTWNAYSLSLDCECETVRILGTEVRLFSYANVEVCALKSVLKTMRQ